ncbi:MAG: glycosyl transferase, partial [Spirochaetaceae bacterium]
TWQHPESLDLENLDGGEALSDENIGALLIKLGTRAPGETATVITQLGQTEDMDTEWEKILHYSDPANVRNALDKLSTFWEDYLAAALVHTPDAAFDRVTNTLLPRQCHVTTSWSRDLSLYQSGFGSRGTGFRDCAQDVMGICIHNPLLAKSLIEKLCMVQCCDGHAMHQFFMLTIQASAGDSREHPDRPSFYSDDHLWLILATTTYVKETGDFQILDKVIPFYEKTNSGKAAESASVREHLSRALDFTARNLGKHGLPLAGFADWNDTVNLPTGSESVFTACLYGKALTEAAMLASFDTDRERELKLRATYEQMKETVNSQAWDGAWYIAYFDPAGKPIGSNKNEFGKIFGHTQAWAVISGFADTDRAKTTMESVDSLLATPYGTRLSWPGYNGYDPIFGGVSTYPPGAKENGGIFCHAHAWMVIALVLAGHGNKAYDYFCQTNPALKNDSIDIYEMEPYCYPQNILGTEHPKAGRARNSWLTGTASWTYQAAMRYILGIRSGLDGLEIDPCLPSQWEGFTCAYSFRGCRISIEVKNPNHIKNGVCEL